MKQYWQKLATKIDALTLRERVIIFAMAALIMVVLINAMLLDPQYAKQKQLSERIKLEQSQIAAMQAEIQAKATGQNHDPDSANRVRLGQLEQQFMQMQNTLQGMQKGLISPDRMSSLLEDILRQNRKLRLLSLKTLPAVAAVDAVVSDKKAMEGKTAVQASGSGKDPTNSKPANEASVYRHGVELVIQGNYLDIMDYLTQLESMQWQVFWGEAKLDVEEYPTNKLTLTLYTLSLDKKWLNI